MHMPHIAGCRTLCITLCELLCPMYMPSIKVLYSWIIHANIDSCIKCTAGARVLIIALVHSSQCCLPPANWPVPPKATPTAWITIPSLSDPFRQMLIGREGERYNTETCTQATRTHADWKSSNQWCEQKNRVARD